MNSYAVLEMSSFFRDFENVPTGPNDLLQTCPSASSTIDPQICENQNIQDLVVKSAGSGVFDFVSKFSRTHPTDFCFSFVKNGNLFDEENPIHDPENLNTTLSSLLARPSLNTQCFNTPNRRAISEGLNNQLPEAIAVNLTTATKYFAREAVSTNGIEAFNQLASINSILGSESLVDGASCNFGDEKVDQYCNQLSTNCSRSSPIEQYVELTAKALETKYMLESQLNELESSSEKEYVKASLTKLQADIPWIDSKVFKDSLKNKAITNDNIRNAFIQDMQASKEKVINKIEKTKSLSSCIEDNFQEDCDGLEDLLGGASAPKVTDPVAQFYLDKAACVAALGKSKSESNTIIGSSIVEGVLTIATAGIASPLILGRGAQVASRAKLISRAGTSSRVGVDIAFAIDGIRDQQQACEPTLTEANNALSNENQFCGEQFNTTVTTQLNMLECGISSIVAVVGFLPFTPALVSSVKLLNRSSIANPQAIRIADSVEALDGNISQSITTEVIQNSLLSDVARLEKIAQTFPNLSSDQAQAILRAHQNVPCPVGQCSPSQLAEKIRIMREAGIDQETYRAALRQGLAGQPPTQVTAGQFLIPRSNGSFSEVLSFESLPDGRVSAIFIDQATGQQASKTISPTLLQINPNFRAPIASQNRTASVSNTTRAPASTRSRLSRLLDRRSDTQIQLDNISREGLSGVNQIDPQRLAIDQAPNTSNRAAFVSDKAELSTGTLDGEKIAIKNYGDDGELAQEAARYRLVEQAGVETPFIGVTRLSNGDSAMVSSFVEGALIKNSGRTSIFSPNQGINDFNVGQHTVNALQDIEDKLRAANIDPIDFQIILRHDGTPVLFDVDLYGAVNPRHDYDPYQGIREMREKFQRYLQSQ